MCRKLIYLVSSILLLSVPSSVCADLVGYWKLDEGSGTIAYDSSGNGNDGTLVDNPVWDITWISGRSGGAVEFYGVGTTGGNGDYFDCGSDPSLNMTGPISIALWIRPDADDPEGNLTTTAPMSKTDGSAWSYRFDMGGAKVLLSPICRLHSTRHPEPGPTSAKTWSVSNGAISHARMMVRR